MRVETEIYPEASIESRARCELDGIGVSRTKVFIRTYLDPEGNGASPVALLVLKIMGQLEKGASATDSFRRIECDMISEASARNQTGFAR